MIQVSYKNKNISYMLPDPAYAVVTERTPQSAVERLAEPWLIQKKYRLNPETRADQNYNPDFYRNQIRAGSIESAKITTWHPGDGEHVRAIQTMLHLQTNYNILIQQGLYRQPRAVIELVLNTWYSHIANQFPAYRRTCEYEFRRHLAKYDLLLASQTVA